MKKKWKVEIRNIKACDYSERFQKIRIGKGGRLGVPAKQK